MRIEGGSVLVPIYFSSYRLGDEGEMVLGSHHLCPVYILIADPPNDKAVFQADYHTSHLTGANEIKHRISLISVYYTGEPM